MVGVELLQGARGTTAPGRGGIGVHLIQAVQDRQDAVLLHQRVSVSSSQSAAAELLVDLIGEPFGQRSVSVPASQGDADRDGVCVGAVWVGQQTEQQIQGEQGLAGARFSSDHQAGGFQPPLVGDDVGKAALCRSASGVVGGFRPVVEGQVDAVGARADQLGALPSLG